MAHQHAHHHEHEHEHEHEHGSLLIIGLTVVLLIAAVLIERHFQLSTGWLLLIYLVPYLLVGHGTLREAAHGIMHGEVFNEHFLMSLATIGALVIGFMPGAEHEMVEAVAVMLFFEIGELFEGYAEGRSRKSIAHLVNLRPDVAHVLRNGTEAEVAPGDVALGDIIVVKPGERVPIDGVVDNGQSSLNTVALTGESMPIEVSVGDDVAAGCINLTGLLHLRATRRYADSTVNRIIHLVEEAQTNKSRSETFIARFARVYTPVVVIAAVALAILPPLVSGDFAANFTTWLYRALMFLVISCPCALVISVPLTFFGGLGGASREGILVKGANFMDALAHVTTVVMDKTGTITQGEFAVEAVHPEQYSADQLLHLAAHVEHHSTHPIAAALRAAFPAAGDDTCQVGEVTEIAGQGVTAQVEGHTVGVGNAKLMETLGATWRPCHHVGTIIHMAIDGDYAGHIVINDQVKADSQQAVDELHRLGVRRIVMLTGDRHEVGEKVAQSLGIDETHCELLPADKLAHVERLIGADDKGAVAAVGDGINDAPLLARATVGIAMGALGSDAAIEAADVVIMDDKPSKVATAIAIARRTIAIARQNVVMAIGIKVAVLVLAALGLATMWMAVFADVGVTILATLNATRTLHTTRQH